MAWTKQLNAVLCSIKSLGKKLCPSCWASLQYSEDISLQINLLPIICKLKKSVDLDNFSDLFWCWIILEQDQTSNILQTMVSSRHKQFGFIGCKSTHMILVPLNSGSLSFMILTNTYKLYTKTRWLSHCVYEISNGSHLDVSRT